MNWCKSQKSINLHRIYIMLLGEFANIEESLVIKMNRIVKRFGKWLKIWDFHSLYKVINEFLFFSIYKYRKIAKLFYCFLKLISSHI